MKILSIPKPCTENWNAMRTNDNGAFCAMCNHDVIDFTKKTPDEIRETLSQKMGERICGRINNTQLEKLNSDFHIWDNQSTPIFQSKFLYACVLVFGMTLFTGCENGSVVNSNGSEVLQVDSVPGQDDIISVGMMEEDTLGDSTCGENDSLSNESEPTFTTCLTVGRISYE